MDSYRVERQAAVKIQLPDADAEIEPVPTTGGAHKSEPELDRLSNILKTLNDHFGSIRWTDADRCTSSSRRTSRIESQRTPSFRTRHRIRADLRVVTGERLHRAAVPSRGPSRGRRLTLRSGMGRREDPGAAKRAPDRDWSGVRSGRAWAGARCRGSTPLLNVCPWHLTIYATWHMPLRPRGRSGPAVHGPAVNLLPLVRREPCREP